MFEKLKSIFIVNDKEFTQKVTGKSAPEEEDTSVPEEESNTTSTTEYIAPAAGNTGPLEGKVSEKFTNILFGAIEKANQEGFDYLEFRNSLSSLGKMDMDEATRFKSAFAMAQTMKATPEKLISSANHYLNVLGQEEKKFGAALTNQKAKQVGDKQQQLEQVSKAIRSKAEQIKKLSAEIENHQNQLLQLESEIQKSAGKVGQTKVDFMASYQTIVSQIRGDVEKMQQYLK